MHILKQSTATTVIVGPFLDDTDGKTPETGLTVASIDVDLYKHNASAVSVSITPDSGGNDMAHIANGYYSLDLVAGDVDTLGRLDLTANISGALPVKHEYQVENDITIAGTVLLADWSTDITEADGSGRTLMAAAALLRNRVVVGDNAGNLTVYETDDSTTLWSSTGGITRTSAYDPITEIDPD